MKAKGASANDEVQKKIIDLNSYRIKRSLVHTLGSQFNDLLRTRYMWTTKMEKWLPSISRQKSADES